MYLSIFDDLGLPAFEIKMQTFQSREKHTEPNELDFDISLIRFKYCFFSATKALTKKKVPNIGLGCTKNRNSSLFYNWQLRKRLIIFGASQTDNRLFLFRQGYGYIYQYMKLLFKGYEGSNI